jgi:hypothetical protein
MDKKLVSLLASELGEIARNTINSDRGKIVTPSIATPKIERQRQLYGKKLTLKKTAIACCAKRELPISVTGAIFSFIVLRWTVRHASKNFTEKSFRLTVHNCLRFWGVKAENY